MKGVFSKLARVLTFRFTRDDILSFNRYDLVIGLLFTWIVGIGRYWDDPRAVPLQMAGIGSVIYVFVLSLLLWSVGRPLLGGEFRYLRVLTFVTFTAPPALLYAIPVEMFTTLETGNQINLTFLLIVSVWRVALYGTFLSRFETSSAGLVAVLVLLPITAIIVVLVVLNLQHVVLDIMGGIREADQSTHDLSYSILLLISIFSIPVCILCALIWLGIVGRRLRS